MTNANRIKQLKRIGVSPDNVTNYTNGVINPYRSLALAMIERGETVPNDLVEQITYFDACEVNTETESTNEGASKSTNESENTVANRVGFLELGIMPLLIMFGVVFATQAGDHIIKSNNPYNITKEFVSRYGLSVPEDKAKETMEIINKQFWDDEMAVVELVDADGNTDTYAITGTFVYRGAVPSEKFTGIFKVKDDGSYVSLEKPVGN